MSYAGLQDMIDLYGEQQVCVAAGKNREGNLDIDAVVKSCDSATAEINTYLAARYTLPLSETPPVLKNLCIDVALYRVSLSAGKATNQKRQRYEDAINLLKRIGEGKADLDLVSDGGGNENGDQSSPKAAFQSGPPRLFDREKMGGL